jgi:hypothetical protein
MGTVRLFVLHDKTRSYVDVPYGKHLEAQAEIEMQGAEVYHAALLSPPANSTKKRTGARLKQRMY